MNFTHEILKYFIHWQSTFLFGSHKVLPLQPGHALGAPCLLMEHTDIPFTSLARERNTLAVYFINQGKLVTQNSTCSARKY